MALTKITNDLLDLGSDTGALGLPKGTEAQRPTSPVEGTLRHNSEIDETKLETFDGTDWRKINKVADTGPYAVDYLVVAGGGGGGAQLGGGGGAGGYLTDTNYTLTSGTQYTITVGSGGTGAIAYAQGTQGFNSAFDTITSIGGGFGGNDTSPLYNAGNGGSGGGGAFTGTIGIGTSGQGNNGGVGSQSPPNYGTGGGGGANTVGGNGSSTVAGNGGNGLASLITGNSVYYSGGGGGSTYYGGTAGVGGLGGGGAGSNTGNGQSGTANTGGGGGGGYKDATEYSGGNGGSGVVILRIPTANYSGTTTGSPTVTTDGTNTILTYTSSGTYTA